MLAADLDTDPVLGEDGLVAERPWLKRQADDPMPDDLFKDAPLGWEVKTS